MRLLLRLRMNLLLGLCGTRLRLNRTRLRLAGAVLGLHRSGLRLGRVDFRLAWPRWLYLRLAGAVLRL